MSEPDKKIMWQQLHECYAITKLASMATLNDSGHNSCALSVSLDLVAQKLMESISTLDNYLDYSPKKD
jgi:hypothetical protein